MGGETRRAKSLRIGVHHADAVVWGPVDRLIVPPRVPRPPPPAPVRREHRRRQRREDGRDPEPARADGRADGGGDDVSKRTRDASRGGDAPDAASHRDRAEGVRVGRRHREAREEADGEVVPRADDDPREKPGRLIRRFGRRRHLRGVARLVIGMRVRLPRVLGDSDRVAQPS
eukprot:30051-Pelagococcus_subviridis.AAC.2